MTRFFQTLQEVISLLFRATEYAQGGEIYVLSMPAFRIVDLAQVLIEASGVEAHMVEIGIRPSEKLHEILITDVEATHTVMYEDKERPYLIILPAFEIPGLKEHYAAYPPIQMESYSSDQFNVSKQEVRVMLQLGGFI
jgi:FlaA1/EpsC-like NDP-sugar epimerase